MSLDKIFKNYVTQHMILRESRLVQFTPLDQNSHILKLWLVQIKKKEKSLSENCNGNAASAGQISENWWKCVSDKEPPGFPTILCCVFVPTGSGKNLTLVFFYNSSPYWLSAPFKLLCAVAAGLDQNPFSFRLGEVCFMCISTLSCWFEECVARFPCTHSPETLSRCLSIFTMPASKLCSQPSVSLVNRRSSAPLGEQQGEATRHRLTLICFVFPPIFKLFTTCCSDSLHTWGFYRLAPGFHVDFVSLETFTTFHRLVKYWLGFNRTGF